MGRPSAFYDVVTHQVKDAGMLQVLDFEEQERNARYRTRHAMDRHVREQDIALEDAAVAQKHGQIAHQRFEEVTHRGHDIITNHVFGPGPKGQKLHVPFTKPKLLTWERA